MTPPAVHPEAPSCASCRFFNAVMQTCQQSSPKVFFKSGSPDNSVYPATSPNGWCGQWQLTWPGVWPPARAIPNAVATLEDLERHALIEGAPALLQVAQRIRVLEQERLLHCGCSDAQRREGHRPICVIHELEGAIADATGEAVT